jgi:hypothetical protein
MTLKSFKKLANKVIDQSEKMANQLLQSRIVLYIVFFLAVVYLFGLMLREDIPFTVIFLLIGFLTSFFSKNMIVILLTTILATWLIRVSIGFNRREGMEDKTEETADADKKETTEKKENMTEKPDPSVDLLKVQDEIVEKLKELDPLLTKAEGFIASLKTHA